MNVIASSVIRYSRQTRTPIGQLAFDPSAEYAADNQQDKTSLASISNEHVIRYRFGAHLFRGDTCRSTPWIESPLSRTESRSEAIAPLGPQEGGHAPRQLPGWVRPRESASGGAQGAAPHPVGPG
jgi:hypothetical protein